MKLRNLILYNLIFLICVVVTADIVQYQLTGDHLIERTSQQKGSGKTAPGACTGTPAPSRPATDDAQLKAVAEYEAVCKSAFIDDMMLFTNMPTTTDNANQMADAMTKRLQNFADFKIRPVVIVEPDSNRGLVDFHEFATGFYDSWIQDYFNRLKANGISDGQLGVWIPFPEPQQDFWNNNGDPDDFAKSVNRYFKILRSVYPQGQTAILLDSQVGEGDQSEQLLAYTRLVDNSLVDIFGLQGFPWNPRDESDTRQPVTSASVFAPASLVEDVAKSVGTKKVFINTGTYRHRKMSEGGELAISTTDRQATLQSIVHQVEVLRKNDYDVTVNIFAQDKLDLKEGVDWSYWQAGNAKSSAHTVLFTDFVHSLEQNGAHISLFDAR